MNITKPQIKQLQAICAAEFKDRASRLNFFSEFTGQEIGSTKELSSAQADDLIYFLNTGKTPNHQAWGRFDANNPQHRALLSRCHQLGWVQEDRRYLVDLNRLGGWLKSKRSPVQKPVKQMTTQEVSRVIAALDSMIKKKYR